MSVTRRNFVQLLAGGVFAKKEGENLFLLDPSNLGNADQMRVLATGTTHSRLLKDRFADVVNVRDYGAKGDGVTDDTEAFSNAIAFARTKNATVYVPDGTYSIDSNSIDIRRLESDGAILVNANTSIKSPVKTLFESGNTVQKYITEISNRQSATNNSNSTTQALSVLDDYLWRSQDGGNANNKYSFANKVILTKYEISERAISTINYKSDSGAVQPSASTVLQGIGHGDGFAFGKIENATYLYAHASAPNDADHADDNNHNDAINNDAAGVIRIPWSGDALTGTMDSPYVPSISNGCVWYRNIPRVTNGNFGMSSDGKWFLFVDGIDKNETYTSSRKTFTQLVTVYRRSDIESVVPDSTTKIADCSKLEPYAVFPISLEGWDTDYAESGITSDGKNIYIVFSGARIFSKCFIDVYTLEGKHITTFNSGTIRQIHPDVLKYGFTNNGDQYLPWFYEVEGLTFWRGKLITASRYLFSKNASLIQYNGECFHWNSFTPLTGSGSSFTYGSETLTSVPRPVNASYWVPTKLAPVSASNPPVWDAHPVSSVEYKMDTGGEYTFHHYITAFQPAGLSDEEFGLLGDVWEWTSFKYEMNPVLTRRDLLWCYDGLNTQKAFPIMYVTKDGDLRLYNADEIIGNSNIQDLVSTTSILAAKIINSSNLVWYATNSGTHLPFLRLNCDESSTSKFGSFDLYACKDVTVDNVTTTVRAALAGTADGSLKWNGQSIQTSSDERQKTPIVNISDEVLEAWGYVNWGEFQFLDAISVKGEKARLHTGVIAQHIKDVFEQHGLDACKYGIICHDVWEDEYDGDELIRKAGDLWTVRYTEALAMEAAYQRDRADKAEARIAALEEKVVRIEALLERN